jgi:hypothetical protein
MAILPRFVAQESRWDKSADEAVNSGLEMALTKACAR